jgi:hypothetical protein
MLLDLDIGHLGHFSARSVHPRWRRCAVRVETVTALGAAG